MLVTAFANSGKKPLKDGATLLIENGSQTVLEEKIFPNSFGLYNYGYKISSLDVAGEIRITVRAADEFQNTGSKTSTVFFSKGRRLNSGLEVSVLSLDKEIRKNQVQKIEVLVTDKSGKKTGGAKVKLTFSKGPSWVLEEKEEGIYVGSFKLSETVLSGEQQISVTAKKQVEGEELEGEFVEKVSVLPLSLKVFVNGLAKESYGAGDAVELKIFAVAAGRQVLVKEASLTLDGQEVLLKKENGFFSAKIIFGENSPQELRVSAADEFQNSGFVVVPIKITGYSLNYFFQKNLLLIFAALVILSASIAVSGYFTAKKEEQERLKKREKEIFKELTALQKKYFEVGFMQRQAYDKMVLKYENELKEIKKKLGGAK
ncbi:MAG: hypothetical protein HYW50_03680 [Candidatus Diapherotrites archaeon]|nr:hypothetical protein [Candidatus Diapherotrites archaeon]